MLGLAPSFFRAGGSAPDPAAIFGANLTAWYDSRAGVTEGIAGRTTAWQDQIAGIIATNTTPSTTNSPKYIASDVDGTPTVWWDPGESNVSRDLIFQSAFTITPNQTLYCFMELPSTASISALLWSTSAIGFFHWQGNTPGTQAPAVYASTFSTWVAAVEPVTGWVLIRFGGSNAAGARLLNIDNDVEQAFAAAWPGTSPVWQRMGRSTAVQHLKGKVKQMVVTNTYVADADAEHAAMLAWMKYTYPTLVTY